MHNVGKTCKRWEQAIADEKEKKATFKEHCIGKIKNLTETHKRLADICEDISAASDRLKYLIKPDGYLAEYAELCE